MMYDLGYYMTAEEFQLSVFDRFDKSGDKELCFDEFKKVWHKINSILDVAKVLDTPEGKQAVEYFQYYDKEGNGHLNHDEFKAMFENLVTYNLTNGHTCDEVLNTVGKDGKIDFNEYLQFMGYITATPRNPGHHHA